MLARARIDVEARGRTRVHQEPLHLALGQAGIERALELAFGVTAPTDGIPTAGRTDRAIARDLLRFHGLEECESTYARLLLRSLFEDDELTGELPEEQAVNATLRRIVGAADAVTSVGYFDNTLYMVSHKGAPRSRVIALKLDAPDIQTAKEVIAESERVIVNVVAAADALYIEARDGNIKRLFKRAHAPSGSTEARRVPA
jgi:hypothetical protein